MPSGPLARPITLPDILEQMAESVPDREAVVTRERTWTYAEVDDRATRLANHLDRAGVRPGDRVAVHATNRIEWVDALLGVMKLRAVPINVNYRYEHDELVHVYGNSGSSYAIVAPEYAEAVERVRAEVPAVREVLVLGPAYDAALAAASPQRPDPGRTADDLYVLYTGGTTGSPKGVIWRQEDIVRAALNMMRFNAPIESVARLGEEAAANATPIRMVTAGPLMHGGSQWILGNSIVGGAVFVLYTERSFDPVAFLDLAAQARINSLVTLGDAMARPVAEAYLADPGRWDLTSVFAISNGAAPLSEAVRAQLRQAFPGCVINDSYGSSESGAAGTRLDDGQARPAPRFDVGPDVTVLRPDRTVCSVGEVGLLARSGPIPLGYLDDAEKTARTFVEIDGRRWVIPGDAAVIEADGAITLLGRGSVVINTGGEKVHPEEVEGVLLGHPDVQDAAVVGTPHPRWGQQVTAVVELREDATIDADDLRRHCRGRIADFKIPKDVLVVDRVPRTAVSKVDYPGTLRLAEARLAQHAPAQHASAEPSLVD